MTNIDAQLGLRTFPGYAGVFTRDQAPSALLNGSRVRKTKSKPDDAHKDGELATVLGSMHHPKIGFGYFVEWDSHPRTGVFVASFRIESI